MGLRLCFLLLILESSIIHAQSNLTVTPLGSHCSNYLVNNPVSRLKFTGNETIPPLYLTASSYRSTFANFTGLDGTSSSSNLILGSNPLITKSHLTCVDSHLTDYEKNTTVSFTEDGRLGHSDDGGTPELYLLDGDGGRMNGVFVGMNGRVRWALETHTGLGAGSFFWVEMRLLGHGESLKKGEDEGFLQVVTWDHFPPS